MLVEAKALGADAVLLVVGSFRHADQLAELHAAARALDLDAIVEVSEPEELEMALEVDVRRDRDQQPQPRGLLGGHPAHLRAAGRRPAGKIVVSESGISTREQIEELERVGVDAVLAGERGHGAPRPRGRRPGADRRRGADPA